MAIRHAAEKLIPVTLELGGKSPMIGECTSALSHHKPHRVKSNLSLDVLAFACVRAVMEDANFDKAVNGAILSMRFTRQGELIPFLYQRTFLSHLRQP